MAIVQLPHPEGLIVPCGVTVFIERDESKTPPIGITINGWGKWTACRLEAAWLDDMEDFVRRLNLTIESFANVARPADESVPPTFDGST